MGIRYVGIVGPALLKTDSEGAIIALWRRAHGLPLGAALGQALAAYGHESSGVIEHGNRLGEGVLRVRLVALEARIGGRAPCTHPAFAWPAEHSADVLSKYLMGKDGKTAYERLYGKAVHEEALEFGECLWWRPPKDHEPQRLDGAAVAHGRAARTPVGVAFTRCLALAAARPTR